MAWLKRGRTKRLVLDIGTSAIRLAELSPTKTGYQLTKYFQRDALFDPAMEEDEKKAARQEVLDALLKEAKVRTKKTILAVPGQSVFTRNRPLPPVPEYKVTQIVRYEIQQQIPFSLDQIALDYQVLDRTEAGGYDVMMAAIKVDVVDKCLEILEKTKRSIDVVDVAPLAAYNWLRHTGEFGDTGECVALIDLGATTTDIVIQKDNHFRFTRSLNIGGNDVTAAIASAFNMTFADAEKTKRERGFAPTGNAQKDGKGGEVVGEVLERLTTEITRSFAYFRSQPGGGPTSRVIVTGGGACLRNMVPYLQRQLGIEVRIAQPLAGLAVAPTASEASEHPEQSCVALGLALRCCETVPIQINLIPPRVLESARRREQILYWVLSLATMFLIMASIIPVTAARDDNVQKDIKFLRDVLASYDPAIVHDPTLQSDFEDDFTFLKNEVNSLEKDVRALDSVRENRTFWLDYLKYLNDARPEAGGITISSIETAIIGGEQNTGQAWRASQQTQLQNQDGAATPATFGAGAPAPEAKKQGSGAFGGARLNDILGRGNDGGGSGSSAFDARGFPGIHPPNDLSGASTFGPSRGGRRQKPTNTDGPKIIEPNGFIVYGYASDTDTLLRYVERLSEVKEFVAGGVYFHVSYADEVAETELDKAQIGGKHIGSSGGSGRRKKKDGEKGGLSSIKNLSATFGAAATTGRGSGPVPAWLPKVTAFRIDVQFTGKSLPQPGTRNA